MIELCLSAPYSNEIVERFFSFMKVVKSDLRSKLKEENIKTLVHIKVKGPDSSLKNILVMQQRLRVMQRNKEKEGMGKGKKYKERSRKTIRYRFTYKFINVFLESSDEN